MIYYTLVITNQQIELSIYDDTKIRNLHPKSPCYSPFDQTLYEKNHWMSIFVFYEF